MKATHKISATLEEPQLSDSTQNAAVVVSRPIVRRTIIIQLPLLHNPNAFGFRIPVSFGKFRETFREMKDQFSGFNVSACLGWCTEDGIWDPHLRIDLDTEMTPHLETYLISWREVLRLRFDQRSIHMAKSGPIFWIEA